MVEVSELVPDVSRETMERLKLYEKLLRKWNPRINLVSKNTLDALWDRHFIDSAQLWTIANEGQHWADLGSGGGFPGLVIATIAAELRPNMTVTLVESDSRKATFLRSAAREMGISPKIYVERIESLPPLGADILSARALAPLTQLCAYAERHLSTNGYTVFPKGEKAVDEIKTALASWRFQVESFPSKTDANASILKLEGISRA